MGDVMVSNGRAFSLSYRAYRLYICHILSFYITSFTKEEGRYYDSMIVTVMILLFHGFIEKHLSFADLIFWI